ncbi:ImmA/IrrE family metallo-endopeptidase [Agrobacterium rosae]|uniref:XRE family transcriptional regulator n=1 Tax=Agrobacterium rosae TaxID=1972867 RepID=UPI0019D3C21F|nr:XRE family transcriptional regulator [Agrobacterium rosae]MBN7806460.1 ImmA/IrrE family metallo-endopeptidase [Agrobacterium rosae]MBN7806597.1 ImmA/IrrE family metallo-endopeptidase [Agrobacterium rosae]
MATPFISTDRQAREANEAISELDRALSSEQELRSIVEGLPREVVEGIRRALKTERREREALLRAYQHARSGEFSLLKEQAGNDPGAFLIVARITRGLSQKDLARKLGLREQAVQRWEAEKYRSISLSNFQKVAQSLGVRWQMQDITPTDRNWPPVYDVSKADVAKVLRHARQHGWLETSDTSDENATATLIRYVGDHVNRYGTPSLLRTGLNVVDHTHDWSLLSWKAQVSRRAEAIIAEVKPKYRPIDVSWLIELVRLSQFDDGPTLAVRLLLEHGIVFIAEPQISGMSVDGAAFLIDDVPVIGMTLLRDTVDNFWFTLLHEVAHIILHYRTGLSSGFFDDLESPHVDEFEEEANQFASNLLIPDEVWSRSPARIAKTSDPVEKLATRIKISPAIIFGRIRMERNDYSIFSNKIGRGTVRKQLLKKNSEPA